VDVSEAGSFADRSDPAVGGSTVEPLALPAVQDQPLVALADGEVEGAGAAGARGG
jgi:hypothetical protein